MVVIDVDHILPFIGSCNENLGRHVVLTFRAVSTAWSGIQVTDPFGGLHNLLEIASQFTGNIRKLSLAQKLETSIEYAVFERKLFTDPSQLEHQALPQIPGSNTRWIKTLNQLNDLLNRLFSSIG